MLLNLAGIDVTWGTAPQPDEIRKLDHERMLKDALFSEETTSDDLMLAQALLAERSPEDIAAALARLYRARLPSPEDIMDPGQSSGRAREDRGRERDSRPPRGEDRSAGPRSKKGKSSPRHVMGEGSVWFRASIGAKKNAEARWLLPMICRRGGIDKQDIGAIRIMDTTTEFEISERAAESFAVKIRRPDKEDNIRIEPLGAAPQSEAVSEKRPHAPRREVRDADRSVAPTDRFREERAPKPHGKSHSENGPGFGKERDYKKKKKFPYKSGPAGSPPLAAAKAGAGKKVKHRTRR